MSASNALGVYQKMRDFALTPEPQGAVGATGDTLAFVVQKHAARSLHYDFRLELDGTLKSWAVSKGPSLDPTIKRMAVHVEDHPLAYGAFEGVIPAGHYGAGSVIVWDRGTWSPVGDARAGYREGKLKFDLHANKLHGRWALVRMHQREGDRQAAWLLMKDKDTHARNAGEFSVVDAEPDSVLGERAHAGSAAAFPAELSPQLASLVDRPPPGNEWLYEVKFDGYRLLTRADGRSVHCFTRNGHDWSAKLPGITAAVKALGLKRTWLDGEIVVGGSDGLPDFQALQNAFESKHTGRIQYHLFDMPFHAGQDLRDRPVEERRARLEAVLATGKSDVLRFSEAFEQDPAALLASARSLGVEGLIGKRKGSPYRSRRSTDWIKLKARRRQEFVIGGFTDPQGSRTGIGSLMLGVHAADGRLHYAGNVGSGFDERTLAALRRRLEKLASPRSAFVDAPARVGARENAVPRWVKPTLLAEVSFAQWTHDQHVRHAVFHGLRNDKAASGITREQVVTLKKETSAPPRRARACASTRVTHAERVIDAHSGVTKGELVDYQASVAAVMLPHLRLRPVALVRAPTGVDGELFFQKHAEATTMAGVDRLDPALDPGHEPLLAVTSREGLLAAAQLNVIEFHTWNATARAIDRPDRIVFDLDPGTGVPWSSVQEAAQLLHAFLGELGLANFLKTSGGKGLHVVVPLVPRLGWEAAKGFAQAVVRHMAQVIPDRFVSKSGPKNRVGKIYIDDLRNGFGATTACAWSARARPSMGVSVPIAWEELGALSGAAHWNVRNIGPRIAVGNSPLAAYSRSRQGLSEAMRALGFKPPPAAPGHGDTT